LPQKKGIKIVVFFSQIQLVYLFLKKTLEQITQEIGPFITNLLKINTRNLLNKKLKSKKPNSAFLNVSYSGV
jgi:hypothetical protein